MINLINNAGKSVQFKRTHCSTLTERVLRIKRTGCSILAEYTDVLEILFSGEVIESYPDDSPYPSFLLSGCINFRPLHVVIAHAVSLKIIYIVTAYEPDSAKWEDNFRRRK